MITLDSLKHYDEKSKELISTKQDRLKGTNNQIVSFDEEGKVISKDFSEDAEKITFSNEKYNQFTNINEVLNNLLERSYYVKPTCSLSASVDGKVYEKGTVISSPITFTWTINKDITTQSLTDCELTDETVRTAIYDSDDITTDKVFTLLVSDGENEITDSVSYKFLNKIHFGNSVEPTTYDSDFILGLANSKLTSSNKAIYNFNCSDGEYAYFATPTEMKITSAYVNGFQADLEEVVVLDHTNESGYTTSYTITRFRNASLGSFSAEVK